VISFSGFSFSATYVCETCAYVTFFYAFSKVAYQQAGCLHHRHPHLLHQNPFLPSYLTKHWNPKKLIQKPMQKQNQKP
jgi:hypothetical protein